MTRRTKAIEAAKSKDVLEDLKVILDESDGDLTDLSDLEQVQQNGDSEDTASDGDEYVASGFKNAKATKGEGSKRKSKYLKWSLDAPFDALGDELLILIFSFIEPKHKTTKRFPQVSKRFRLISQTSYARSQWLLRHYHKSQALYHAIHFGILDTATLDSLVESGRACFSRYFAQMVCRAYNGKTPRWLPNKWGNAKSIPFGSWLAVLNKSYALWGEQMSAAKDRDDSEILRAWIVTGGKSTNVGSGRNVIGYKVVDGALVEARPVDLGTTTVDEEWAKIKALFETYRFSPFSPTDPFDQSWLDAIRLKPDILHLLLQADVDVTNRIAIAVVRPVLTSVELNEDGKIDELRRLREMHPKLVPGPSFFCSMLNVANLNPEVISLYKRIEQENLVSFRMSTAFRMAVLDHSRQHGEHRGAHRKAFYRYAGYYLLGFQELGFDGSSQELEEVAFLTICFLSKSSESVVAYLAGGAVLNGQRNAQNNANTATVNASQAMTVEIGVATLADMQVTIHPDHLARALQNSVLSPVQVMQFVPSSDVCTAAGKAAATRSLCQPHQGVVLRRLLRDVPGVKSFIEQLLVNGFTINLSALNRLYNTKQHRDFHSPLSVDKHTSRSAFRGYVHRSRYARREIYVPPPAEFSWPDEYLWADLWGSYIPDAVSGSTATWTTLLAAYKDSPQIVQLLLVHGSLGNNSKLVEACLATNPALSSEYFEHLARLHVPPSQTCYRLIKQSVYRENVNRSYKASKAPVEDLMKWRLCLTRLVETHPDGSEVSDGRSTFCSVVNPWLSLLTARIGDLQSTIAAVKQEGS